MSAGKLYSTRAKSYNVQHYKHILGGGHVIDHYSPHLIVNLGVCGGFEGVVQQSDLILVEQTFIYDIVELMGDLDIATYYASSLDLSWLAEPHPCPV
jgi:adenosylhomocysteine nucleosidase